MASVGGVLIALAAAGPATAADMPVKVPGPVVYSWTGFYLGAVLGGKWAETHWTTNSLASGGTGFAIVPFVDASSSRDFRPASVRVGGYFGYNWQFALRWVAGIELDMAWADKTVTTAGIPGCTILCAIGNPGPAASLSSVSIRWDASVRARLGFLATPNILIYGTGGIAWHKIQASATCQFSDPDPLCFATAGEPFGTATDTFTRVGWTAGGGIDWHVYGNWIARAEYRYADFGARTGTLNLSAPDRFSTVVYQLKASTQIATFGLAYRFGN